MAFLTGLAGRGLWRTARMGSRMGCTARVTRVPSVAFSVVAFSSSASSAASSFSTPTRTTPTPTPTPPRTTTPRTTTPRTRGYATKLDLPALDRKWQARWAAKTETKTETKTKTKTEAKPTYVLPMFPYPSGLLHMGHLRVYTIADVTARALRMQGHDVLLPMGWDAFGLPAENAALQRATHPAKWTRDNIGRMRAQLDRMNGAFDWSREVSTCEPTFYKHTQRLFLELHKAGLAYQAEAEVNYDPVDRTVLANEQVDAQGRSWRSGAVVERRRLRQWFFRISAYRDALLDDLARLERDGAWPERVVAMQRHWLGKSEGAQVAFTLLNLDPKTTGASVPARVEVYTTRLDTLPGVQYLALAATHPAVQALAATDDGLRAFLATMPGLSSDSKAGYELPGIRGVSPLAFLDATPEAVRQSVPVFVAPYVLGDYGEGAVMGVPAHDTRDYAFWAENGGGRAPRVVVRDAEETTTVLDEGGAGGITVQVKRDKTGAKTDIPFTGHGVMTEESGPLQGLPSHEASAMLGAMLGAAGVAKTTERWRLRDWLVSRQRYWGTPIPIVHCGECGAVPVPVEQLPVELPPVPDFGQVPGNPLEREEDWVCTTCPSCGGPARRDTDTMDTFVDSSWYYMRFADPHNSDAPFAPAAARSQLPVDIYMGGIEHAILHLLYARFIYKFLMQSPLGPDVSDVSSDGVHEPFARLITQGMVHGKTYVDATTGRFLAPDEVDATDPKQPVVKATGARAATSYEKMSKSKHNGVDPVDTIARHGADATRAHVLFSAPVADVLNWDEAKISGVTRWLARVYDLLGVPFEEDDLEEVLRHAKMADVAVWRAVQTAIGSVTTAYARVYALNTVVSDLMRLTNTIQAHADASPVVLRAAASVLVRLLAPVTPAFAEEAWQVLGHESSVFDAGFPVPDGSLDWLAPPSHRCAVQVNGKLRCAVDLPVPPADLDGDRLAAWLTDAILATPEGHAKLAHARDLRAAKKTIVIHGGKLVNYVF